jgi:peptidoglycan/xylan/chitin deacetylase (PgdA/CDA1 family)
MSVPRLGPVRARVRSVAEAVADPATAAIRWRGRIRPTSLFATHARLARRSGINGIYLVLSFDCDTTEDAEVAPALHRDLLGLGVNAAYAVPGRLLREGRDAYREIAATGAEFLNHGHEDHAEWSAELGRWVSRWFYDELTEAEIRADVVRGHADVRDIVGSDPQGFRAPHFGTFQRSEQLRALHALLRELGYRYSSSTVPVHGFRDGPVFERFGLVELPVSGAGSSPLTILDSWGCFAAPNRRWEPADYEREARSLADAVASAGAGVINCYADPSHVAGRAEFMAAVQAWTSVAQPLAPRELVAMVSQ